MCLRLTLRRTDRRSNHEKPCNVPIERVAAEVRVGMSQASVMPVSGLVALLGRLFDGLDPIFALSEGAWIYCSNGCCT